MPGLNQCHFRRWKLVSSPPIPPKDIHSPVQPLDNSIPASPANKAIRSALHKPTSQAPEVSNDIEGLKSR